MRILDLRGADAARLVSGETIPRPDVDVSQASAAAAELIAEVRERGAEALREHAERFDGVRREELRATDAELAAALRSLDPKVRDALETVIERVRAVSGAQLPQTVSTTLGTGALVEQRWQPVGRVGLYVPGGKAVYPSSVVMNAVPAQVAGVGSIALASPPQRDFGGSVHPSILAAAALLGVDEVYAMGGASAIGAFAYGVPELDLTSVDVVTGPGNVFVAAAKRLVRGIVGIDAEAGPTEILIIADSAADPALVAADLVSQAEHDELAAAVLVTWLPELADAVAAELTRIVAQTPHRARVEAALSGQQSAVVLVDDAASAARFSDSYAPEHLELLTADNELLLTSIHSAGAIFVGPHSPVSLGDYLAGSNHVLPTGGQARFTPGLGVHSFLRPQQIIRYDETGLSEAEPRIRALATAEDLPAHADAVTARLRR
ncbi:MAG TPA: histidinol dehydrogenase [Terrimesophilobacter sp.]|nr:histidinol dehydrogenase [Terrimesophilobacter sp.]